MTTDFAGARAGALRQRRGSLTLARARLGTDAQRHLQVALGLAWLLDGALQFQSFMYSKGFIAMLTGMEAGQPSWLASSINWGAHLASRNLDVYNTLFALVQCAIGLGLLFRPTVRPALAASFAWALVVWWFGEAFGMMFMATTPMGGAPMASALTGAPGAVSLYALIGAIAWPTGRPGGLLGVRGARLSWAALWLVMAYLWLVEGAGPDGIHNAINAAPSGMSWLSSMQDGFASVTAGNGVAIAWVLAAASAVIGIGVGANRRPRELLGIAVALNLLYWLVGQGIGGIFQGHATDPNAGPLFCLLAYAMYSLIPHRVETRVTADGHA